MRYATHSVSFYVTLFNWGDLKRKEDMPGFKHAIHNICVAVNACH